MEKKKFLFYSYTGLCVNLARKIYKEGYDVKLYIKNRSEKDIGDGFVPKTSDWRKEVDWADVVIFDDALGQGAYADKVREKGKRVVGGTAYTDSLEDDRTFGQEELKKAGVSIIPYKDFTDFDEAVRYIESKPDRYVLKPSGEAQNIKRLLFVGEEEDGKDVIKVLEAYKKIWSKTIKQFQLQKRVMGVEVAVTGFFNGTHFISPININFEHKKLFPGNIGPSTGEMGTSMFWSEPNRLFNQTLKKMESRLRNAGYIGSIDINCIVNKNGIYPLEFTARFGYPAINIQAESMITPVGKFFYQLASGNDPKLKVKSGFQVGVRLIVPPYPFKDHKTFQSYSKDAEIMFKKGFKEDGVCIEDVKRVNDHWFVAGSTGVVMTVVGLGPTMKQAQKQVYSKISNIMIPNMYFRTDIGDRWFEDFDRLHSWGYLRAE